MLCSERELALSDSHTGIMELPEGTDHGQSFIAAMGLEDTLIEVDLTPNRPDCASVIGIAREIAGKLRRPLRLPVAERPSQQHQQDIFGRCRIVRNSARAMPPA